MLHVIGTIELRETHTFERRFETACNYERVECKPQTAALVYDDSSTGFIRFSFDGTVVEYHYVNSIGSYGKLADDSRRVGQSDRIAAGGGYAYNLHRLIADERYIVRLRPDVEHVIETVPSTFREGETHTFSRIIPAERTFERKLNRDYRGGSHDTGWLIVNRETGETVRECIEPGYQNGRMTDANIVILEAKVAERLIDEHLAVHGDSMVAFEFEF